MCITTPIRDPEIGEYDDPAYLKAVEKITRIHTKKRRPKGDTKTEK